MYKEEELEEVENTLKEINLELGKLEGKVGQLEKSVKDLEKELEDLKESEEKFEDLKGKSEELKKKLEFVNLVREILKEAIPQMIKAYTEAISVEANRIFCEIMDDFSWQIELTEDFGIKAKYMGREISFQQMSGGEQVVAALSVRLALLKFLSSAGVVFFDEPTQNMDEERRRNFARQITNIKGFRQIFVITHDDTFEEMVENVIRVRKENGVSVV